MRSRLVHPLSLSVCALVVVASLAACRGPRQRAWTKEQERQVAGALLPAVPTPGTPIDARFDDKLRLIGVDVDRKDVRPGESVTVTWYWESLAEAPGAWKIFVHFEGRGRREPFDHDPVGELLPISKFQPGQIVKDVQVMRIAGDFPEGEARIWAGVFDAEALRERQQDVRMQLTNPDAIKVTHEPSQRLLVATVQVSKAAASKVDVPGTPKPATPRPDRRQRRYTVNRAPGPITIDGRFDDAGWGGVARTSDFVVPQDGAALGDDRRPEARLTWDDQNLYVAFFIPDGDVRSDFSGRDSKLWEADVVEIYLDPGADGVDYLELQVAPTGEIFDAKFASRRTPDWSEAAPAFTIDMVAKVAVDGTLNGEGADKSWAVEIAIPFAGIPGGAPAPDSAWAMNLYRLDASFHSAWAPVGNDYHNLPSFGRAVFTASPPAAAPAPTPDATAGHALGPQLVPEAGVSRPQGAAEAPQGVTDTAPAPTPAPGIVP